VVGADGRRVARERHREDVLVAAVALGDGVPQGGYCGEQEDQPLDPDEDAEGRQLLAPLDGVGVVAGDHATVERGAAPARARKGVKCQPKDAQYREHTDFKLGTTGVGAARDKVDKGHDSKQRKRYDGKDEGEAIGDEEEILVEVDPGGQREDYNVHEEKENVGSHLLPAYG